MSQQLSRIRRPSLMFSGQNAMLQSMAEQQGLDFDTGAGLNRGPHPSDSNQGRASLELSFPFILSPSVTPIFERATPATPRSGRTE